MTSFTARDICRSIDALNKNVTYGYVSKTNHGEIKIVRVQMPEGPIVVKRRKIGERWGVEASISSQMIWRVANALNSRIPINVDRVLAGSYNTRSVLEALLAHTPEIYICSPGRQEMIGANVAIKRGHKHIILLEGKPHQIGNVTQHNLGKNCIISEIPSFGMMYDVLPADVHPELSIDIKRRHSQIQVALAEIAQAFEMRTWLAVEDHGIVYNGRPITDYPFIIRDLNSERAISTYSDAINVARHIDCMYFNGGLPFAFEVEHTTGVTSGLSRLLRFKHKAEHLNTQYVIVAPDSDRENVMIKISEEQFEELNPFYFSYSQVEELYSFVSRYKGKIKGVKRDFLQTFMEKSG
jgi:type II restriction enzyme